MKIKVFVVLLNVLAGILVLGTGCRGVIVGSPETETREYNFSNFTGVDIAAAFDVTVTRADSFSVNITANKNLFDYIEVSQSGNILKIQLKPLYSYTRTVQRAIITMPELRQLQLSGASHGTVVGFSSTSPLDLQVSGASSITSANISAGDTHLEASGASRITGTTQMARLNASLSGASTLELNGSGTEMVLDASGASTATLRDFPVTSASVTLSGASRATVNISGRLDANLSGASNLQYTGNPTLGTVDTSGASSISRLQ